MTTRRGFLRYALFGSLEALGQPPSEAVLSLSRTKTALAVVPVFVGGVRLEFVVDTGATESVIASEALRRLSPADFTVHGAAPVAAAGGRVQAGRVSLRAFAFSPGAAMALEVNAISFSGFGEQFGADVDGVLAMDLLERYSLRMDFRAQQLELSPPQTDPKAGDALADLQFEYDQPLRAIEFPARVDGRPVTAILDTGAVRTAMNWPAAQNARVTPGTPGLRRTTSVAGVDGNLQTLHEFSFQELQIGQLRWSRPALVVADLPAFAVMRLSEKSALLLGMDFLGDREIAISFPRRRLRIR